MAPVRTSYLQLPLPFFPFLLFCCCFFLLACCFLHKPAVQVSILIDLHRCLPTRELGNGDGTCTLLRQLMDFGATMDAMLTYGRFFAVTCLHDTGIMAVSMLKNGGFQ